MPLRDHFHSPLRDRRHPEGLHPAWIGALLRRLASQLPPRYFAEPEIHLGVQIEPDVATFEELAQPTSGHDLGNGAIATALWAATAPSRTATIATPARDTYQLRIYDAQRTSR